MDKVLSLDTGSIHGKVSEDNDFDSHITLVTSDDFPADHDSTNHAAATGKMLFDLSKVSEQHYGRKLALNIEVHFDNVTQSKRTLTLQIDKPTAIEAIEDRPAETRKLIKDGRLYILHQGTLYDVQGKKQ